MSTIIIPDDSFINPVSLLSTVLMTRSRGIMNFRTVKNETSNRPTGQVISIIHNPPTLTNVQKLFMLTTLPRTLGE